MNHQKDKTYVCDPTTHLKTAEFKDNQYEDLFLNLMGCPTYGFGTRRASSCGTVFKASVYDENMRRIISPVQPIATKLTNSANYTEWSAICALLPSAKNHFNNIG
jgi:hypothetical protein